MQSKSAKKISRRTFLKYGAAVTAGGIALGEWSIVRGETKKPILIGITSDSSGNSGLIP